MAVRLACPPFGITPDRGHPWAQKMAGFYAFNEGGGPRAYDGAGRLTLALVRTTYALFPGDGLVCNVNGAGAAATVPVVLQAPFPLSFAVGFRLQALPNNFVPIWGIQQDNSTTARLFNLELTPDPGVRAVYNGGTTTATTTIQIGTDYVLTGTCVSGTQSVYLNGVPQGGGATAFTAPWTATAQLLIGGGVSIWAGRNPNTLVYWAAWWTRVLTAGEHAAIGGGPAAIWALFPGVSARSVALGAVAVAASRFRRTLFGRAGSRGAA